MTKILVKAGVFEKLIKFSEREWHFSKMFRTHDLLIYSLIVLL